MRKITLKNVFLALCPITGVFLGAMSIKWGKVYYFLLAIVFFIIAYKNRDQHDKSC